MKKILVYLLVCASLLANGHGSIKALDEKNGFRELKFGMSPKECGAMYRSNWNATVPHLKSGEPVLYEKGDDLLKIGGNSVKHILYGFYQDVLYEVEIMITDSIDAKGVFKIMTELYGQGQYEKTDKYPEAINYKWDGNNVQLSFLTWTGWTLSYIVISSNSIKNTISEKSKIETEEKNAIEKRTKF